ncbi:PilZ domain-containing protein [Shewanella intestini]|uniref:PilZ domain-containing protein n=1 Tax=Shewanella intestini TaxID=2017544 RepID=A0ABS5I610_9GAMM|nr:MULTISPECIES: PilZ domain-containing protein [Shewanella]MBR9729457.1 PilZ domain-containing protein [Shewanella intestini]MRG35082.1 hypothetical protein [Shewanella sp. XMDDZSB0408]
MSEEELACFNELFSQKPSNDSSRDNVKISAQDGVLVEQSLSVSTEIPQVLTKILGQATLTLLAEVSHYRLWFPLALKRDELGQFIPVLGVPEVLDARGSERSWRVNNLQDVSVLDSETRQPVKVLSLSSSGVTVELPKQHSSTLFKMASLMLPGIDPIEVEFEPVRTENGVMAARINTKGEAREALRHFLFREHKAKYSHLYAGEVAYS